MCELCDVRSLHDVLHRNPWKDDAMPPKDYVFDIKDLPRDKILVGLWRITYSIAITQNEENGEISLQDVRKAMVGKGNISVEFLRGRPIHIHENYGKINIWDYVKWAPHYPSHTLYYVQEMVNALHLVLIGRRFMETMNKLGKP